MTKTFRYRLMCVLAIAVGTLFLTSRTATADEPPPPSPSATDPYGFNPCWYGSNCAAEGVWPPNGGIYIIGDSISTGCTQGGCSTEPRWQGAIADFVVSQFAAHGMNAYIRSGIGMAISGHMYWDSSSRNDGTWPDRDVPSFTDAANSNAKAVLIELGTNDLLDQCTASDDTPNCLFTVESSAEAAINQLLAAGKVVIWSGPRNIDPSTAGAEEPNGVYAQFNNFLASYAANQTVAPEKFFYANWDQYVLGGANQPEGTAQRALYDDLVLNTEGDFGGGHIHPNTAGAIQAIANWDIFWALVAGVDNLQTAVLIPSNGATLRGTAAVLDASASGPSDVTGVQFEVTGATLSHHVVGTATPTMYGWIAESNTTQVPNGTYTLRSVATDSAGTVTSAPITITVSN